MRALRIAALFLFAALLCRADTVPKFRSGVAPLEGPMAGFPEAAKTAVENGLRLFSHGDFDGAEQEFRKFLKYEPDDPTGLVNLGIVEYRLKHLEESERLLKRAVRVKPEIAQAWLVLGVVYYETDNLDAALAELSQAVLLDPKNAQAHNYLGVTIGRKGWTSGAEEELEDAIELDPAYAEAHFNLALFSLQRSPPAVELARRHYQKALDLGALRDPLIEKELDADTAPAK